MLTRVSHNQTLSQIVGEPVERVEHVDDNGDVYYVEVRLVHRSALGAEPRIAGTERRFDPPGPFGGPNTVTAGAASDE